MIEGKIFYEHSEYSLVIDGLDSAVVERIVAALKGIVVFKRPGYGA